MIGGLRNALTSARPVRFAALLALVSLLAGCHAPTEKPQLTVAISSDIPPYVMQQAETGLEIDIVKQALPAYTVQFIQMPYQDLQAAVPEGRAEVAVGVQHFDDDDVFYSDDFVTFENVAVTKQDSGLQIESVADLANYKVLTWQDAWQELGPEFERLFSPQSAQRANYVEIADQSEQVRMFWEAEADVIVIDRSIFGYFSAEMEHSLDEVVVHSLFPVVTNFRVAFQDADLRDVFNQGLQELCESGDYPRLLRQYHVDLPRTICDP